MTNLEVTAISGLVTAVAGYFLGKRKIQADASKTEAEAGAIISLQWQTLYSEVQKELYELRREVDLFRKENKLLVGEVHGLRIENGELKTQIDRLSKLMGDG